MTTEAATTDQAAQDQAPAQDQPKAAPTITASEAELAKHQAPEKQFPFCVTSPGGTRYFLHARSGDHALIQVAKHVGLKAARVGKPVNPDQLADQLERLTTEQRDALLAKYLPAGAVPTGNGTHAPKPKGKKQQQLPQLIPQ